MKSLYKVLNIIALVAVIALMGGCFSPWAGDGATITINVGGGSGRAVFPPDDETLAQIRYTVELQGPSNTTEQLAHGTQSINLSVIPGDYTITVTARLADGELYAISIATAIARAGQSTRVDITMQYVGDGFIIFFDTNGSGTSIEPKIIRRGEKVERPDNPTWGLYGFVNWYSDKDLKNKFDFNIPVTSSVTSNITLYAKWNTVTHTVTFDSNNDSGAIASEIVGDGGTLPQPKEEPILNGSVFGGWYIDDDEYVFNTEIYADIILCAKWNDPIFDDIANLGAYLFKWETNDPAEPYTVWLNNVNDISTMRATLNDNAGKHVYLDLSGSTTITTIPANAFYGSAIPRGCATLVGITIPNSVNTIDNYAFRSCANLASVTIGNNVTSIGAQVFTGCPRLEEININSNNNNYSSDNGVLYDRNKTVLIAYPSATGSITIPGGVTTIGDYAFQSCTSLTSVTIGSGVKTIGENAFSGCTNLNSVTIGSGVTTIGTYAFGFCTQLDDVTFTSPSQVTTIGQNAFQGCANLTSITIPDSVTTIENSVFNNCTGLTSVTIGSGVTTIGQSAFASCSKLGTITIPSNVTTIGSNAFSNTGLTDITIPDSVTSIGNSVFYNCIGLISITINANIVEISIGFFTNINSPTLSVTIGNNITGIGQDAFRSCANLTSVTIGSGVKTIGQYAFASTKLTSVTIPDSVTSIGSYAFSGCTSLTSVTIGSGVTSIGNSVFNNCTGLTSVTINTKIIGIENDICGSIRNLASVTIGNNVESIDIILFTTTYRNLTAINVDADNSNYSSLDGVLYNKGKTTLVAYPQSATGSFTIPNNVTTIGDRAFFGCAGLTSVTIPGSVTSIGQQAFDSCTSLTSVTIPSSVTTVETSAFGRCTNLTSVIFVTGSNITNFRIIAFPEGVTGEGGNTLMNAYNAASSKAGTYTRPEGGTTWAKAP